MDPIRRDLVLKLISSRAKHMVLRRQSVRSSEADLHIDIQISISYRISTSLDPIIIVSIYQVVDLHIDIYISISYRITTSLDPLIIVSIYQVAEAPQVISIFNVIVTVCAKCPRTTFCFSYSNLVLMSKGPYQGRKYTFELRNRALKCILNQIRLF